MIGGWSQETKDRTFYATLVVSAAAVAWLVWPFIEVLAFAAVVAAVSSPVHEMLTQRLKGRRMAAALMLMGVVLVVVVVPMGALLYRATKEAVSMAGSGLEWINSPDFDAWTARTRADLDAASWIPRGWVPSGSDPLAAIIDPLRNAATTLLGDASRGLPTLLNQVAFGVLDTVLFVLSVVTFLAEGPRIAAFVEPMMPLDTRYQHRLFEVFRRFAAALVLGTVITAIVQGVVAAMGFAVAGLPNPLVWGVATSLGGFVPLVGTAVVLVPACLIVGTVSGWGWGLGLLVYSVAVVGTVDNLIKPLIMSGRSDVHPLLIFLSVFGGMWWMGLTGVFIGPVLVSFFLALATIHAEDFAAGATVPAPPEVIETPTT